MFILLISIILISSAPMLNGSDGQDHGYAPKDGDYLIYEVSGWAYFVDLSGEYRVDFINVTENGYDTVETVTGFPGSGVENNHHDAGDMISIEEDYGNITGSMVINTEWGLKRVDVYTLQNDSKNVTSYISTDQSFIYRVDISESSASCSIVLTDTNIESIEGSDGI